MKTSPRIGLTMKNAKGINRERRLFFQAGTECDFTLSSAADPYIFDNRRRRLIGFHPCACAQIASTKPTENTAQPERTWGRTALRRPWRARRKLSPRR